MLISSVLEQMENEESLTALETTFYIGRFKYLIHDRSFMRKLPWLSMVDHKFNFKILKISSFLRNSCQFGVLIQNLSKIIIFKMRNRNWSKQIKTHHESGRSFLKLDGPKGLNLSGPRGPK